MIITKIKGGLGNQMFQYAAGKALSCLNDCQLKMDVSFYNKLSPQANPLLDRIFELTNFPGITDATTNLLKEKLRRFGKFFNVYQRPEFHEKAFFFDPSFFKLKPSIVLDGYWQSEKYFQQFESVIRNDFRFRSLEKNDYNTTILNRIRQEKAVSVHVRRGDYLTPGIHAVHGVCSIEYYKKALTYMDSNYKGALFVFFSDDPDWVSKNLSVLCKNNLIVKGNVGADSWKDMFLMSECNHHIIANSSFSWWGAWLNSDIDKITIAPRKWFNKEDADLATKDLIPHDWIRL